jgi:hypothetical protein
MKVFGHKGQIEVGITTPASIMARGSARANAYRLMLVIALTGNMLVLVTGPASASHEPAATILVSADTGDGSTNADSYDPSISADGTKIAYESDATDIVAGDTNGFSDVFLHDTVTGVTTLISAASGGGPANGDSRAPSINSDGTKITYQSRADPRRARHLSVAPCRKHAIGAPDRIGDLEGLDPFCFLFVNEFRWP